MGEQAKGRQDSTIAVKRRDGIIQPVPRRTSSRKPPRKRVAIADPSEEQRGPRRLWRVAKAAVRLIVLALVAWGVYRVAEGASGEFQKRNFSLSQIEFGWLAVAGGFYLAGLLPCAIYWRGALMAMGQRPRWSEVLRAFYVGHLGKYVPGKALVVILRTGLIRSDRVSATVAAVSVFVETLSMMAVGAFVAAAILALRMRDDPWLLALSLALMVCAGAPLAPPVFRAIIRLLKVRRADPQIETALGGLTLPLLAKGSLAIAAGWGLIGLSLWATLKAIPGASPDLLRDWPLLTACVALAVVAGFASLIPGGIGVRELVVIPLLAPSFGEVNAIVSAVLLRVTWMAAELFASAILSLAVRKPSSAHCQKAAAW
jgi:uncharacterized membrane protein YbhN (UPF0104 family)